MRIKEKRKIINWNSYNKSLISRASITLWLSEDCARTWYQTRQGHEPGRPRVYSDHAVLCMLTIRAIFRLPLRGVQGFVASLIELLKCEIGVINYTTLSRRQKHLQEILPKHAHKGHIDLVIDSTGLKVYGEGEWKVRQHGASKRRVWRKLHLAINPETHMIEANLMTTSGCHDSEGLPKLVNQVLGPIKSITGDGAYDCQSCYQNLEQHAIQPIIPPRHNAIVQKKQDEKTFLRQRDTYIVDIEKQGRAAWKKSVGYHRRSLAETAMFRFKTILGSRLASRSFENQVAESTIKCRILNTMTSLGMPVYKTA